ncbi:MAG TPA: YceI family protein [Acidimicrobiales bacterium]|nr:YceI family protein [Acidimicrobiales bacterium]
MPEPGGATGSGTTRFRIDPGRSGVWTESRSSVHPIRGQAVGLEGDIDVRLTDGRLDLSTPPSIHLELDVERLRSGNSLYDNEMQRRIEARRYPTIAGDVTEMKELDSAGRYRVTGDLQFHGVTRPEEGDVTLEVRGGRTMVIEGEHTFDVRAFDIEPPKLLMLKVSPEVKVQIRVVAQAEQAETR